MDSLEKLSALASQDNFGPNGILYTGILDPDLKNEISSKFASTIDLFKVACNDGKSDQDLLLLLKAEIQNFERHDLDTEDAENLAGKFGQILDCVGLESSDGILNKWMYGDLLSEEKI